MLEDMSIRQVFPEKLKYYMQLRKKTMPDLVHDLGFKYSTVRDWVIGKTVPRMDKVEVLAVYFGCSSSDLLENKEPTVADELSNVKRELIDMISNMSEAEAAVMLASLSYALGKQ